MCQSRYSVIAPHIALLTVFLFSLQKQPVVPTPPLKTGLCALSGCHPEQNPALAGQNIYKSREVQDTQIARLVGKVRSAGCRVVLWAGFVFVRWLVVCRV